MAIIGSHISRFCARLPRGVGPTALPLDVEAEPTKPPARGAADSRQIEPIDLFVMVVDDDADTCEAPSVVRRKSGAIVRTARSMDEAQAIDTPARMDAVINDISMPGSGDFTLVREIREHDAERGSHTIVIAMTGIAGRNNRDKSLATGFDKHIAKPVELRAMIATLLGLMRARR